MEKISLKTAGAKAEADRAAMPFRFYLQRDCIGRALERKLIDTQDQWADGYAERFAQFFDHGDIDVVALQREYESASDKRRKEITDEILVKMYPEHE